MTGAKWKAGRATGLPFFQHALWHDIQQASRLNFNSIARVSLNFNGLAVSRDSIIDSRSLVYSTKRNFRNDHIIERSRNATAVPVTISLPQLVQSKTCPCSV